MEIDKEKAITLVTEIIKTNIDNITNSNKSYFCDSVFNNNVTANDFTSYYVLKSKWNNTICKKLRKQTIYLSKLEFNIDFVKFSIYEEVNISSMHDIGKIFTLNMKCMFIPYKKDIKYIVKYPEINRKLKINEQEIDLTIEEYNFLMSCYVSGKKLCEQQEKEKIQNQEDVFLDKLIKKYNV